MLVQAPSWMVGSDHFRGAAPREFPTFVLCVVRILQFYFGRKTHELKAVL